MPYPNKQTLIQELHKHQVLDALEQKHQAFMLDFIAAHEIVFGKQNLEGHFTASAWVLSPCKQKVLLLHHKKLDLWLQPGGHIEADDSSLFEAAHREAIEESGLTKIEALSNQIYDVDVHKIPKKGEVPAHWHLDVRYVFQAASENMNIDPEEVKGFKWVAVEEMRNDSSIDPSIGRMVAKTAQFQ